MSARAQRPTTDGDWGLRRGATRMSILSLHAAGSQLTVRDSSGVHSYPVRLAATGARTLLLVSRPQRTDSLPVQAYGRRTLFVDVRRGGRTVARQVFGRLTPPELARYRAELRRMPSATR